MRSAVTHILSIKGLKSLFILTGGCTQVYGYFVRRDITDALVNRLAVFLTSKGHSGVRDTVIFGFTEGSTGTNAGCCSSLSNSIK